MMDFIKYLPIILRIIELLPKIRETIRNHGSVMDLLRQVGPDIMPLLVSLGGTMFPEVQKALQGEAAALQFDPASVRVIQQNLNKLAAAKVLTTGPLVVDGSYGEATKAVVKMFQTKFNINPVDGWAGKITASALQSEVAKLT
jgi:Putative peptidoglycan binding domain